MKHCVICTCVLPCSSFSCLGGRSLSLCGRLASNRASCPQALGLYLVGSQSMILISQLPTSFWQERHRGAVPCLDATPLILRSLIYMLHLVCVICTKRYRPMFTIYGARLAVFLYLYAKLSHSWL